MDEQRAAANRAVERFARNGDGVGARTQGRQTWGALSPRAGQQKQGVTHSNPRPKAGKGVNRRGEKKNAHHHQMEKGKMRGGSQDGIESAGVRFGSILFGLVRFTFAMLWDTS